MSYWIEETPGQGIVMDFSDPDTSPRHEVPSRASLLDCFTVYLHVPDDRQICPTSGCAKDCQCPLKSTGIAILTAPVNPQCIAAYSTVVLNMHCGWYFPKSTFRTASAIISEASRWDQKTILVNSLGMNWEYMLDNRHVAQNPRRTRLIFHNAPFCNRNVHACAHFCYKMKHRDIFVWCIAGFVRWVN